MWRGKRIRIGAGWAFTGLVAIVVAALSSFGFSPAIADGSGGGHSHADATVAAGGTGTCLPPRARGHVHTHGSTPLTDLNGHPIKGVKAADVAAEAQPDVPLDPATRATLQQQLVVARDTAMRYPTVADALAAGYHVVGGFGPGSGAHYIGGYSVTLRWLRPQQATGTDLRRHEPDLPDGRPHVLRHGQHRTRRVRGPERPLAPPQQRVHEGQPTVLSPPDADISQADCAALGGFFMTITGWMVHAWVVPSWESPDGVFSHENPNLRCADGTFNTDKIGACQGS